MGNTILAVGIYIIIFIGLCVLQLFLVNKNKKIVGLILPLGIFLASSYAMLLHALKVYRLNAPKLPIRLGSVGPWSLVFILVIIPTIILLVLYRKSLKRIKV